MALVNELTNKEEKLLEKMLKGNSDIQLMASDGNDSIVCVGDKRIEPIILLLCHITPNGKVCNGKIADKVIGVSFENELNVTHTGLRIIIDRRNRTKRNFYGCSEKLPFILKEDEETNEKNLFIAYIENQSFAQLTIFNSRLQSKISEIVVRKESIIKDLRNYAFTLITTFFPSVNDILQDDTDSNKNKINELTENH